MQQRKWRVSAPGQWSDRGNTGHLCLSPAEAPHARRAARAVGRGSADPPPPHLSGFHLSKREPLPLGSPPQETHRGALCELFASRRPSHLAPGECWEAPGCPDHVRPERGRSGKQTQLRVRSVGPVTAPAHGPAVVYHRQRLRGERAGTKVFSQHLFPPPPAAVSWRYSGRPLLPDSPSPWFCRE